MSDELWLKELAQIKRDQDAEELGRFDERWDRLSAGTLSPEEEAELQALAGESPEAAVAYEAFRPFGADFQARVVQKIMKIQEPEPDPVPTPRPTFLERLAKLLPFWGNASRPSQWAGWSATAAAAVMILLRGFPLLFPPPPLPVYADLSLHADQFIRGGKANAKDVTVLTPGGHFQGELEIDSISKAKHLEAQYVLIRGQDLHRLQVASKIAPGGAVKLNGSIGRDVSPGDWTFWAVVGRRGKLPDPSELKGFSARAQIKRKDWVAVPTRIQIRGEPPP